MKVCLLLVVLALGCVSCGDRERAAFEEGKENLAGGHREEARRCFRRALGGEDSLAGQAHYELGRLSLAEADEHALALWHFQQAVELYRAGGVKTQEIVTALHDCEAVVLKELSQVAKRGHGGDDLSFKVELLEDHARKQSRWLEELRRENALLRRQLSEHD